jgi:hypothetical protein
MRVRLLLMAVTLSINALLGHWTIGIGRNVDVNGGLGLSDAEVDFLLEGDIARVIKELSTEYAGSAIWMTFAKTR